MKSKTARFGNLLLALFFAILAGLISLPVGLLRFAWGILERIPMLGLIWKLALKIGWIETMGRGWAWGLTVFDDQEERIFEELEYN